MPHKYIHISVYTILEDLKPLKAVKIIDYRICVPIVTKLKNI